MIDVLWAPKDPVSENCGKKAAFATPTLALAETNNISDRRTSGRRSNSVEGSPVGTSGKCGCSVRLIPRVMGLGFFPKSTLMAFSVCSINC